MLESLLITMLVITIVFQLVAIYEESIVFTITSLIWWMILMASSLGIEVPYQIGYENATGVVNITTGSHVYNDMGFSVLCLAFAFVNLILLIIYFFNYRQNARLP